ncbi:hypothetical protein [Halomarina ordinaria]|uniref:Uncharacterized protein n=1 Tax=Halomarina ordinaria TaxID=3033939 RepID=A0ABD5U452_9EURY|nr:hypothetical protein [Halomarina sp. PSRA2]
MRVRDWQDVLRDVVESKADPGEWRAVAGDRRRGLGEDLYLSHPRAGVYQLKTYAKNPYEVRGVGAEVARRVDDDIDPLFPRDVGGRFGVQSPPEDESAAESAATRLGAVVETHLDAPTTPDAFFEDVMDAVDSPAYGPMDYGGFAGGRTEALDALAETFEEAERLLDAEFDDLVTDDVGRGFQ